MADGSTIQWTDATWNPVRGCSKVSEGCRFCYAMLVAARFSGPGLAYEGLGKMTSSGPAWTGRVRTIPKHLDDPLRWTRPRRVFVNSMSDLFHESLPIEAIADVFAVMYLAPRHTFQVLTKRARRMREVLTTPSFYQLVLDRAAALRRQRPALMGIGIGDPTKFPAPWVHLGVSVENREAEERIEELRATPAGTRFLSCEPLLEHIAPNLAGIGWVIVGGESHPGGKARRFDVAWARSIVKQCRRAGVPVFVKQLGAHVLDRNDAGFDGCHDRETSWPENTSTDEIDVESSTFQGEPVRVRLIDGHGGDPSEWPADLRVRQFPEAPGA